VPIRISRKSLRLNYGGPDFITLILPLSHARSGSGNEKEKEKEKENDKEEEKGYEARVIR